MILLYVFIIQQFNTLANEFTEHQYILPAKFEGWYIPADITRWYSLPKTPIMKRFPNGNSALRAFESLEAMTVPTHDAVVGVALLSNTGTLSTLVLIPCPFLLYVIP